MAADQKNFQLFTYVDDSGLSWNKRGEDGGPASGLDGHAAFGANPNWGRETRRHSVRKIVFTDPTTFRTVTAIMYTAAAYNAVDLGTTAIAVHVPGETATVDYLASARIPERQPSAKASRQDADHA